MEIGVESVNRKKIWMSDAETALSKGMILTAKSLYTNAIRVMPKDEDVWMALAQLELNHGTSEALDEVLLKVLIERVLNICVFKRLCLDRQSIERHVHIQRHFG